MVIRREFPELPLVGVGAIIIEGDRVLLVKRAHPPIQGQWSIPGGVLEVGEMVREAAVREAREETGLVVEPGELLGVYDRILRDPEQRVQYHYVLIDFLCRPVGGTARRQRCGRGAVVHGARNCPLSDSRRIRWKSLERDSKSQLADSGEGGCPSSSHSTLHE